MDICNRPVPIGTIIVQIRTGTPVIYTDHLCSWRTENTSTTGIGMSQQRAGDKPHAAYEPTTGRPRTTLYKCSYSSTMVVRVVLRVRILECKRYRCAKSYRCALRITGVSRVVYDETDFSLLFFFSEHSPTRVFIDRLYARHTRETRPGFARMKLFCCA